MALGNLRNFLDTMKRSGSHGTISPINTFSSIDFSFYGPKPTGWGSLDSDLIYYVQDITIPQIQITSGDNSNSPFQQAQSIKPIFGANATADFSIINTKKPILEKCFLPWLNQTRNCNWNGGEYPYPIADITISFKEKNVTYYLYGCRPTALEMLSPTQKADGSLTRKVTFNVDFVHAK